MTSPAAVLFDLDGTLIDTEPLWMAAEDRLAAEFGIDWTEADKASLVGIDLWDGARVFIAKGVPVALVTMSTRAIVDRVEATLADHLGLAPFDATVAGDDCERGKPDPEPYERGLALLGVDAADAVAVEDSFTGARSALAAGLTTIGVPHAVDVSQLAGVVHWPTLAGRTPGDLAAAIEERRALGARA